MARGERGSPRGGKVSLVKKRKNPWPGSERPSNKCLNTTAAKTRFYGHANYGKGGASRRAKTLALKKKILKTPFHGQNVRAPSATKKRTENKGEPIVKGDFTFLRGGGLKRGHLRSEWGKKNAHIQRRRTGANWNNPLVLKKAKKKNWGSCEGNLHIPRMDQKRGCQKGIVSPGDQI